MLGWRPGQNSSVLCGATCHKQWGPVERARVAAPAQFKCVCVVCGDSYQPQTTNANDHEQWKPGERAGGTPLHKTTPVALSMAVPATIQYGIQHH